MTGELSESLEDYLETILELQKANKVAIRNFLENLLLLDAENAEKNACRMEHAMDKNAIDRLVQF